MNWHEAVARANSVATPVSVDLMDLWAATEAAAMRRVANRSNGSELARIADVHAVVLGHPTDLLRALGGWSPVL